MFKKLFGVFVLMFLMAIAIPVLAQRYDSCNRRGHSNARYDRGRDHGYRGDQGRRNNRRAYYGGNNGRAYYSGNNGYYAPAYYPQTYYAPNYYVVRRRPVRRVYNNYGYRPYNNRRSRGRVSFTIGF